LYRYIKKEGNEITNKFVESTNKNELLEIFTKCLVPFKVKKSVVKANLEHALNGFKQEMRGASFQSFIKSSPKDMRQIFYQILVKHFIISINSDKDLVSKKNFNQITTEIENLLN
jgi:hypothetical protein